MSSPSGTITATGPGDDQPPEDTITTASQPAETDQSGLDSPAPRPVVAQGSVIRRYITWRNNHAYDERLRRIIDRSNVA